MKLPRRKTLVFCGICWLWHWWVDVYSGRWYTCSRGIQGCASGIGILVYTLHLTTNEVGAL